MTENEKKKATITESIVGVGIIFLSVWLFGKAADAILGSNEKAEEAKKHGYDI